MKVEKTLEQDLKREFSITVPANDIEEKINVKLNKIGQTAKVPGFRPGKIPADILRKKYLKDVMGEVLQDVVTETSAKALNDNKIRPVLQPSIQIEEFDEGKDLKYKMSLEIMPDIPKVDLTKISVTHFKTDVADKDVKDIEKDVLANHKDYTKVDRAAKDGDAVIIDFKGFIDGEAFEGGEAQGHQLAIGSGTFIPGFEEQLIGKKSGDDAKVDVSFPEGYHAAHLSGKDAVFEVKVHEVQEAKEAKADDEFAKKIGFEDLGKLRETIKSQVESDGNNMARVLAKKDLFDYLDENYDFEIPRTMVEQELQSISAQFNQGHNPEEFNDPSHNHKSDKEIEDEYGYLAVRRVKLGLLLTEIGTQNEIKVTQDDVNKAIVEEARRYPGQEMQVFEFFKNNPDKQEQLKGPIIEEKVVDLILEKAKVKEEAKPFSEIRNLVLESNKKETTSPKKKASGKKKVAKSSDKKSTADKSKSKKKSTAKKSKK